MTIWQVADYGLRTYRVVLPLMRGNTLELPQNQPFVILRVMPRFYFINYQHFMKYFTIK